MTDMPTLADLAEEYEFLDADDRYRLLIDLGRALEPMPDALKTDATLVRGCSAAVWVYPTALEDGRLHFLADSNAAITKGIIALVLLTVQDRAPADISAADIEGALAVFQSLGVMVFSVALAGLLLAVVLLAMLPIDHWMHFQALSSVDARWVLALLAAEVLIRLTEGVSHAGYRATG